MRDSRPGGSLDARRAVWHAARPTADKRFPMSVETWELASYVVTVVGLPLAIFVFLFEQRKERENEEEEVYQLLSDNYQDFLKVALENPDLKLFSAKDTHDLTPDQSERMVILFTMLVSLFERAYLLLHENEMTQRQARRWGSWEDYMREWCQRGDFRALLPKLLAGEDPQFADYIRRLAEIEAREARADPRRA
jgi:hypothetical protein